MANSRPGAYNNETRTHASPTEHTPLLPAPRRTDSTDTVYTNANSQDGNSDASSITTVDDHNNEILALLYKVNSNVSALGLEPEVLPKAGVVGGHGDYGTGKDGELLRTGLDDDLEASGKTQLIGVTQGQFWLIFSAILLANFVGAFDSTIMASTHTSITSSFNSSELASWLSTSFLLTATSFQPLFGRVSDVTGRKLPFIVSSTIFTLATVWCALAQSIGSFIVARAVCGFGAGGMLTMGSVTLSDMIPIETRATYQSINNLAWGTGAVLGAALGGFLADSIGWRWEFGIQVPFGIFVVVIGAYVIPSSHTHQLHKGVKSWKKFQDFDWAGSFYLTTAVGALILGMSLGGNLYPWSNWRVLSSLAAAVILGILLYRTERRANAPVLPLDLILSKPQGNVVFSGFFTMLTVNSIIFNLPLYFQTVLLESATKAGTRLLIPSVASTIGSAITGFLVTYTGRVSYTMYFGSALVIVGSVVFCNLQRDAPSWVYTVALIPANLGQGAFLPSQLMAILGMSWNEDHAVATGNIFMLRALGSVIGIASSGLILQNGLVRYLDEFVTGEGKEEIIRRVRNSVTEVLNLAPEPQLQVIRAYEASLRWCFLFTILTAFIATGLMYGVKLPNLKDKECDRVVTVRKCRGQKFEEE